jgi:uncharacterized protein YlzI (FlbEa/FlbD family)
MWKIYLIAVLFLSGCSKYAVNAAMCEKIEADPNETLPRECRNYNKEEAQKAFDKTKKKQSSEDIIEVTKE